MSVMKTSLTIIPMCPRERFSLYKSLFGLVLCYKKDWAILLHFIYFCYLLLVTNYRWVMTHKYMGSIIVLSISKSVEPNEEQKEMISSFQ